MRLRQEKAAVADDGFPGPVGRAGVHGHAFADDAVRPDRECCRLALVAQILRRISDRGEGKNSRTRADARVPRHDHVADEFAPVPEFHMRPDRAERADLDAPAEPRALLDEGRRVNEGFHVQSVTSMAPTSAWATSAPSTFASPRYHHILRRLLSLRMWYSTRSPGTTGLRNFALSMVMKNICFGLSC